MSTVKELAKSVFGEQPFCFKYFKRVCFTGLPSQRMMLKGNVNGFGLMYFARDIRLVHGNRIRHTSRVGARFNKRTQAFRYARKYTAW